MSIDIFFRGYALQFTLKQLRYVDAALRTGSIAHAAREMNISQSSISAAIDATETLMGVALFHRMPAKGIRPTEAGVHATEKIAQFLSSARILESDLMSSKGVAVGSLRMGCYAPTAPFMLPRILNSVRAAHPQVRVEMKEGDMENLVEFLNAGEVDVALTYRRVTPETMPFMPLFPAPPWALIPEAWPLAQKPAVSLHDLAAEPMIMLDLASTHHYFGQLFKARGLSPNIVYTTRSSSVLRGLVAANYGYSILNICGPQDRKEGAGYVCRPITGKLDTPSFGLAYTRAARHTSIVSAMLSICARLAQEGAFDDLVMAAET
ncbi:LysR family transcriptional regulator [uncultured Lentibacter sp.]|jgi:DNA-binding transcriptional LysR family regulator|uniref:LysR family transcriptional regulator n=1 Tax=uncultured Lentibacter sp. TaxID=1659309 RepID=UPI00261A8871|nr:LysR family transcriptional regulator [uncultured Lentibacter sp.]